MAASAKFRCIAGCAGRYPLDQVIYRCPTCGDLLEVVHDLAALRERSAGEWKQLFAERWRSVEEPWGTGVWGKHEWVAPQLRTENIVSMVEGGTHLMRVPRTPPSSASATFASSSAAPRTRGRSRISG